MPELALPLRHTWVSCPEGRLVVRPTYADGNESLLLDGDGVALLGDEVQIGVVTTGDVLVKFRDELHPTVFAQSVLIQERTGLWVGNIEGTSGVDLAAPPGRYLLTGWFDQTVAPHARMVVLGIRAS